MPLSTLWTLLFFLWIALELWVSFGKRASKEDAAGKDRGSKRLLWIVITLSLTANGFLRSFHLAPMPATELSLKWAAIALIVLGLVVRFAAIQSLGSSFTGEVATRADQQLNRSGLYSLVRHPSYLGMEIVFLAISVHARDWLSLAVVMLPTTWALLHRIRIEEAALRALFGSAYDDYCQSTKRLIPGIY